MAAFSLDIAAVLVLDIVFLEIVRQSPGLDPGIQRIITQLLLIFYFPFSQIVSHNTLGKYVMGIQVANEYDQAIPSTGKILMRELSRVAIGIGILFRFTDPKHRGWHDSLGDTIVVHRPVDNQLRWRLVAGLAVCLIATFAFDVYIASRDQHKAADLNAKLATKGAEADAYMRQVEALRRVGGSPDVRRSNNEKILPLLDQYESSLHQLQDLIQSALQESWVTPPQADRLRQIQDLYATMLELASVERERSRVILAMDLRHPAPALQTDLRDWNATYLKLAMTIATKRHALQPGTQAKGAVK